MGAAKPINRHLLWVSLGTFSLTSCPSECWKVTHAHHASCRNLSALMHLRTRQSQKEASLTQAKQDTQKFGIILKRVLEIWPGAWRNSGADRPKATTCNNTPVALLEMTRGHVVWQDFDDSCEATALELFLCLVMFDTSGMVWLNGELLGGFLQLGRLSFWLNRKSSARLGMLPSGALRFPSIS